MDLRGIREIRIASLYVQGLLYMQVNHLTRLLYMIDEVRCGISLLTRLGQLFTLGVKFGFRLTCRFPVHTANRGTMQEYMGIACQTTGLIHRGVL